MPNGTNDTNGRAKRRLADEYDDAQDRGEIKSTSGPIASGLEVITASDIGLSHKDIHEARLIRDAEEADPLIVCQSLPLATLAALAVPSEPIGTNDTVGTLPCRHYD